MKRTVKAMAILLSVLLLVAAGAGCAGAENTPEPVNPPTVSQSQETPGEDNTESEGSKDIKDIKVGVSVGHTQEERWQREIGLFEDYAAEKGFELLVQSADNSAQKQVSQCENLVNQGIDILILQSLDASAVAPIIDIAHEEGVPVISYDRFAMNCDVDYYITFDSFKVGAVQADFVTKMAPKGNYIWLKGAPEDNNAHLVAAGQQSILQPFVDSGDIKIVLEQWCNGWDPNEALKHTENALTTANNDVQGVVASNDGTAGGAIQALTAQGLNVPIAGQDADLAACQRIVEGTQTGTVYKPLAKMNLAAMQLAVALATGQDITTAVDSQLGVWTTLNNNQKEVETFSIDVTAINKDNLYEILIQQDQFHSLEDVYKNVPKDQWPAQ